MGENNDIDTMDGLFKEVYADDVEGLVPDSDLMAKIIQFVPMEQREGNLYHQPVILSREQGFTLNGGATAGTAFALNNAEAAQSKDAQIQGIEFVLVSALAYGAASRLLKTPAETRTRAFVQGSSYLVENMIETASFVREVELLYGQTGMGTVLTADGPGAATTQTYTLTNASWASGIWAGMENGFVDGYLTSGPTKRNAIADVKVTSVDTEAKSITLTGNATDLDDIVTGDDFYFRGGLVNDMAGLDLQLTNTGTIFNIDAALFSLWRPNQFDANGGPLSFTKIIQALNKPVSRGLKEAFCFLVSPPTWTDIMNDLSALRRYADKAGGSLEQGSDSLMFYSQSGHIEIKPHIYMKAGEAFGFAPGKAVRVGSDDITFRLPGGNDRFFENLPGNAGYGLRCYWNQAWIFRTPARGVKITGIVNSDPSA